jgi:hypothetical protein
LRDLAINLVAIYVFAFVIYFRRYGNREMTVTMGLLNLFLCTIVITMTMTEFNLSAGFALFALLSMISLRSVNLAKVDVGYLLGAITLGLVNGLSIADYLMLFLCNFMIIAGAWVLDSKWLLRQTVAMEVTLNEVSAADLKDHTRLTEQVQALYELPVVHLRIDKFNVNKGTARIKVQLRLD